MAGERVEKLTGQVNMAGSNNGAQDLETLTAAVRDLAQENATLKQRVDRLEKFASASTIARFMRPEDDAKVQSMVTQITSLTDQKSKDIDKLLKYFGRNLKKMVEKYLPHIDHDDTMWRIVQECCMQTVPFGRLDSTHYFICNYPRSRDEYSEEKYERFNKIRDRVERNWTQFWAASLNMCQGGPTLFIPPKTSETKTPLRDPPRYLFRAYDYKCKGINDPKIVASVRHNTMEPHVPKINILSNEAKQLASKMLHSHLLGPKIDDETDKKWIDKNDNLVSWSSSLLYVIQYANARFCTFRGQDPAICAVDTTKFPKGQFVRDKDLLECFSHGDLTDEEKAFSKLRKSSVTNNGEYLSQGFLDIEGRSCTTTLREIKLAGLWDIYPEFNINVVPLGAPVRSECETYVNLLRGFWGEQNATIKKHIDFARNIATECFKIFNENDIALLILAFREREVAIEGTTSYLKDEPKEVSRYWDLTCRLKTLGDAGSLDELFELKVDDGTSEDKRVDPRDARHPL